MSVHLAIPACHCGLSSWMWCGDNSGKAKNQTYYSSKYIHLGSARACNIINFPDFIPPPVELGAAWAPTPQSLLSWLLALPAACQACQGEPRERTQTADTWVELNFTFTFIKPSMLWFLRVTHPWFSPLLSSHALVFLTNTPLWNVLARRARSLTKIP